MPKCRSLEGGLPLASTAGNSGICPTIGDSGYGGGSTGVLGCSGSVGHPQAWW